MEFFEVVHTQRAVRHFRTDPIPQAVIWRILDAAIRAPSGRNSQPWRWLVVTDEALRTEIARAVLEEAFPPERRMRLRQESELSTDPSRRWLIGSSLFLFENFSQAPVLVIPCLYGLVSPVTDPQSLFAGASIYPAIQNLMLSAHALGVGSVFTTLNMHIEASLRLTLEIPETAQPAAIIPLGYPQRQSLSLPKRRPVQTVTFWQTWGSNEPS